MEQALKLVPPQRVCTCRTSASMCVVCKSTRAWAIMSELKTKNAVPAGFVMPTNPSDQFVQCAQWLNDRQNGMID